MGTTNEVGAWSDGVFGEFLEGYEADTAGGSNEEGSERGKGGRYESVGGVDCVEGHHCLLFNELMRVWKQFLSPWRKRTWWL